MADSFAQFLITKIYTLLEDEASLLGGVHQEFYEICRDLESMKSFLRDAETRKGSISEGVKTWVKQVTDSVYDVEDIIDEFMYYIGSRRQSKGFKGFIKKAAKLPKTTWLKHKYGTELQKISANLKAVYERSRNYSFDSIQEGAASITILFVPSVHDQLQQERELSRFLGDNEIVGVEEDTKLLFKWLMEEEPQRTLISVVGMGGSGKTTLVSKVYKSDEVKRHFDCYAWVTVSQTFVIEDLCKKMIKELSKSMKNEVVSRDLMSTMDYPELVEILVGLLQQKRYLVVLDDVWRPDVWRKLRVALPDGGCRSRVLLTTRDKEIASHSFGVGGHVHDLPPLKKNESWTLFCQKAFSYDQISRCRRCPPELEEVASLIVQKCKGLPLALVSMGGLMSTKRRLLPLEWMKVYNSMNWLLSNDPKLDTVKAILFLSYNDLSYNLKHCFLYCSVFPEDYEIRCSRLIRLWIAEGFIEKRGGVQVDDVANTYLEELISRCMLQMVCENMYGTLKTCRVHDVIRELALSTAREHNLCTVLDVSSSSDQQGEAGRDCYRDPRRLSLLLKGGVVDPHSLGNISRIRSILMFAHQSGNISFSPSASTTSSSSSSSSINLLLPQGFRLLRVLDLQDVPITCLPDDELGNLFNLHYLSLRHTKVEVLPNSIGKLQRLQTLDIQHSKVEVLPNAIVNCQNLQRLLVGYRPEKPILTNKKYTCFKGVGVPSDIWKLKNLQVLAEIEFKDVTVIKRIGSMTQLQRLETTQVRQVDVMELCTAIQQLRLLRRLDVSMSNETETLWTTDYLTDPPPLLQRLALSGKLDKIPRWVSSLNNLMSLSLYWSRLREEQEDDDPVLVHISTLPCLEHLYLCNAYDGGKLCFRKGWFPKLKSLYIKSFPKLKELVMDRGAIPNLGDFTICSCAELKETPYGMEHLGKLQEFKLYGVSMEIVERLRPGGADATKVRHIPSIPCVYYAPTGELCYENLASSLPSSSSSF